MSWEKINKLKRFVARIELRELNAEHLNNLHLRQGEITQERHIALLKKTYQIVQAKEERKRTIYKKTYSGIDRFFKLPDCYTEQEFQKDLDRINDPCNLKELN